MASVTSGVPQSDAREMVDNNEEEVEDWGDWDGDDEEQEEPEECKCLFCDETLTSAASVYAHCAEQHSFNFVQLRRDQRLGFYDCLRLINFIRSKVAAKTPHEALLEDLRASTGTKKSEKGKSAQHVAGLPWSDDTFLTPFLPNDSLLYTFDDGEEEDFEDLETVVKSKVIAEGEGTKMESRPDKSDDSVVSGLSDGLRELLLTTTPEIAAHASALLAEEMSKVENSQMVDDADIDDDRTSDGEVDANQDLVKFNEAAREPHDANGTSGSSESASEGKLRKKKSKVTFATVAEKEKLNINRSYFGSYSGFGIHREMLGDRVRTEAYQAALMENPSLIKGAIVMDLGCGTGILSLFAAKAGAAKVVAVDGSEKMTAVATQVAKVNGLLDESASNTEGTTRTGVMTVVAGMIEELDSSMPVAEHSVDVLVSEWMGYCLLFESMLGSVLYARDKWLKPGGAMLPDTATMFVAGYGKGGTSLSFWENVYGFDMQSVGEEVLYDATLHPIIDVINAKDVITDSCLIKEFDLLSMKHEDVDYTADFHVKLPRREALESDGIGSTQVDDASKIVWCYGLVVWFDTGFTSRFCKEKSVNLTTSPHSPKTHWAQTLLTFKERIALCLEDDNLKLDGLDRDTVGSEKFPAYSISGRISIARSCRYRSIDISLETNAFGAGGAVKSWPVQMFDI
ncbi:hypothetical protein Mapa_006676 [Marchantia paleacea]|nr:hypothetical protein Mapa_006676 [Marchantia paleacea]